MDLSSLKTRRGSLFSPKGIQHQATTNTSCSEATLPVELVDRIIDFLHDDKKSLRSCSLVHRSWLDASRHHIFYTMEVNGKDGFSALLSFLQRSPSVLPYIKELFLRGRDLSSPPSPRNITKRSYDATLCSHLLQQILFLLPSLEFLELKMLNFNHSETKKRRRLSLPRSWLSLQEEPQGCAFSQTKLRYPPKAIGLVSIRDLSQGSASDFVDLLSTIKSVTKIICSQHKVTGPLDAVETPDDYLSPQMQFIRRFLGKADGVNLKFYDPHNPWAGKVEFFDVLCSALAELTSIVPLLPDIRENLSSFGITPSFILTDTYDEMDWRCLELPRFSNLQTLVMGLDLDVLEGVAYPDDDQRLRNLYSFPLDLVNCGLPLTLRYLAFIIGITTSRVPSFQSMFPWDAFDARAYSLASIEGVIFTSFPWSKLTVQNMGFDILTRLPLLEKRGLVTLM